MDKSNAIKIISALADGIDPINGEVLPSAHSFNHPDVIRALWIAKDVMNNEINKQRRKTTRPTNTGKPWSEEEERQLIEGFDTRMSIAALAQAHQRSRGAITSRLQRLGKLVK